LITVKFRVHVSDGQLYAEGLGIGIYISDKTWNALMNDIIETVELCYNLPPRTEFQLIIETRLTCRGCSEA
jgi:hypothetical protein